VEAWYELFHACQFFKGSPVGDRDEAFFDPHDAATLPQAQVFVDALATRPADVAEFALRQVDLR
jgi:hypothetical protein